MFVCASVSHLAARCPARVARCPPPRHDRTCLIYCSRHPSSKAPHRYSVLYVPQPQVAKQPFKPPAPPRRHCQRPQLVKGKSPQGSRVTVQIEQYLLYSAARLTSCSSPTATASRLISSMLPQVSLGASQLLKPASTPPRSYGRRHRSWHYEPQAQPTVEACVDNTSKLRPQASVLAPRPCTCNAQRAAPRETACTPRSSTCVAPRASAWAPRSSTCDAQRAAPRETARAQR